MSKVIKIKTAQKLTAEALEQNKKAYLDTAIKIINKQIRHNASEGYNGVCFTFNDINKAVGDELDRQFPLDKYKDCIKKAILAYSMEEYTVTLGVCQFGSLFTIYWD